MTPSVWVFIVSNGVFWIGWVTGRWAARDQYARVLEGILCPGCDGRAGWCNRTDYGTGSEDDLCVACGGSGDLLGYVTTVIEESLV